MPALSVGNPQVDVFISVMELGIKKVEGDEPTTSILKPFPTHCAYSMPGTFFPWELKKIVTKK